jgi:hypothetical protein
MLNPALKTKDHFLSLLRKNSGDTFSPPPPNFLGSRRESLEQERRRKVWWVNNERTKR